MSLINNGVRWIGACVKKLSWFIYMEGRVSRGRLNSQWSIFVDQVWSASLMIPLPHYSYTVCTVMHWLASTDVNYPPSIPLWLTLSSFQLHWVFENAKCANSGPDLLSLSSKTHQDTSLYYFLECKLLYGQKLRRVEPIEFRYGVVENAFTTSAAKLRVNSRSAKSISCACRTLSIDS